ncbi:MAG TPA: hypothetical protein VGN17_26050 [Bryobacteraceae bacterium]|jgi:hypothetical protein
MATEQNLTNISLLTGSDLSTKQYYAVSMNSSKQAVLATAAKNCIGFLQNDPTSGQTATVAVSGITKAKITDTISIGAQLEIASGGTLVNLASGVAVATAMEAGATGNIISVLMLPNNGLYA